MSGMIFDSVAASALVEQRIDRAIDMRAIGRDLLRIRPRDQAALRPRVARAGGDVIGVEQEGEALVERAVVLRRAASSRNCSKNQVVWARCHLAGLASGIDWIAWSSADSGAARRSVSARTARNASDQVLPDVAARRWQDFAQARERRPAAFSSPLRGLEMKSVGKSQ